MFKINQKILFFLILFSLFSCVQVKTDKKVSKNIAKESIIWHNKVDNVFFDLSVSETSAYEQTLKIYFNDKILLNFNHDNGGQITKPFLIKSINELFVCFFEVYNSVGWNSKKHIYHLNITEKELTPVKIESIKSIIQKVNSPDTLYTRKGFFYNSEDLNQSCFTKKKVNNYFTFSANITDIHNPNK